MQNTNIPHTVINEFLKEHKLAFLGLNFIEMKELFSLVEDVRQQNFTYSSELSKYISDKNLGDTYSHISGVVTMEKSGHRWNYNGGFPTKIFKVVCNILGLSSRSSGARLVKFKSYASMSLAL